MLLQITQSKASSISSRNDVHEMPRLLAVAQSIPDQKRFKICTCVPLVPLYSWRTCISTYFRTRLVKMVGNGKIL